MAIIDDAHGEPFKPIIGQTPPRAMPNAVDRLVGARILKQTRNVQGNGTFAYGNTMTFLDPHCIRVDDI